MWYKHGRRSAILDRTKSIIKLKGLIMGTSHDLCQINMNANKKYVAATTTKHNFVIFKGI